MKRFTLCLLVLGLCVRSAADLLGDTLRVTPPAGWEQVAPYPASLEESPFPTLKYRLRERPGTEIVLTLLPADVVGFRVKNAASLARFSRIAVQPYLDPTASKPRAARFPLRNGLAVSITTPCPDDDQPARVATVAGLLIDTRNLVHVAILHDSSATPEFMQALQTLFSIRPVAPARLAATR